MTGTVVSAAICILLSVESHNNPHVKAGDHGKSVGILQIKSCIVRDCQRIYPQYEFTLQDRYDPFTSVEMARVWLAREAARRHIESPLLLAYVWNAPHTGRPRATYRKRVVECWKRMQKKGEIK